MDDDKLKQGLLSLLLKFPPLLVLVLILLGVVLLFTTATMLTMDSNNHKNINYNNNPVYVKCTEGKVNLDTFSKEFAKSGVFKDLAPYFIMEGNINQVDPVLLASIAFNETGLGTSHAVKAYKNPGGLMNPTTGHLMHFNTLEDGIDKMAKNLYKLYISEGLVTIPQIGNKYAPVGALNDPTNLNMNWVPNVEYYAQQLGGLSMNCPTVHESTSKYIKPIKNAPIISSFGWRLNPYTYMGEYHKGIDFKASYGTSVHAVQGGKVVDIDTKGLVSNYGKYILIYTGSKYNLYGHMGKINVKKGEHVKQGQNIGEVGNTNYETTNTLYFEVQTSLYGERIDPKPFFQ